MWYTGVLTPVYLILHATAFAVNRHFHGKSAFHGGQLADPSSVLVGQQDAQFPQVLLDAPGRPSLSGAGQGVEMDALGEVGQGLGVGAGAALKNCWTS